MGWVQDLFGGGDNDAFSNAANVYQDYLNKGMDYLNQQQAQGRSDITGYISPYTEAGKSALAQYQATLGLGAPGSQQSAIQAFQASPGYQFALSEGLKAGQRGAAASGLAGSGAEAKALQSYGQGLANQEYGQYQQQLAGLAGAGQQAAQFAGGTLGQLGLGYGQAVSGLYGQMGQAQAEAQMAQAAAEAQKSSSLWGTIGQVAGAALPFVF